MLYTMHIYAVRCVLYALYDYYADTMILCVYLDSSIVCAMLYTILSIWGPGNWVCVCIGGE
jgi:hypothetical protein